MYFKYSIMDKNHKEVFNTIEAKNIEEAVLKIENRDDFLFLIEITPVTGGKRVVDFINKTNKIKEKASKLIDDLEKKYDELEEIILQKQLNKAEKEIEKAKQEAREKSQVLTETITVNNMNFQEKLKFILSSDPKSLVRNIKIVNALNKKAPESFGDTISVDITKKIKKTKPNKPKIKKTFIKQRKKIKKNEIKQNISNEIAGNKTQSNDVELDDFELKEVRHPKGKGKIKPKDILMFTKQLQIMIKSDIGITNALATLATTDNEKMNNMLLDIRDEILKGNTLSYGMSYYPQYFESTYIALIQIGEKSSSFENVLGEIVAYKEKADKIHRKVKTASIYPIILGLLLSVMGIAASLWFIPIFEELYSSSDMPIPALTNAIFVGAGNLHIIIPIIFLIIFGLRILYGKVYFFKNWWDKIWHKAKLKLPFLKNISKTLYMYNFSSTLSIMLSNDIRLQTALKLTKDTINNIYVKEEVDEIERLVTQEGIVLSDAIGRQTYFDNLIEIITITGEKTGSFAKAFHDIADFYNKEINSVIDATMEMVEPLSIILLGAIILPIAVGLYMPMLEMTTGGFLDL